MEESGLPGKHKLTDYLTWLFRTDKAGRQVQWHYAASFKVLPLKSSCFNRMIFFACC